MPKILIVEDDQTISKLIAASLMKAYPVLTGTRRYIW